MSDSSLPKEGMWKMFEAGRFSSPKNKMFKVFRLIRSIGKRSFSAHSNMDANEDLRQLNAFNPKASILAEQRRLEIELQKNFAIWTVRAIRARECH